MLAERSFKIRMGSMKAPSQKGGVAIVMVVTMFIAITLLLSSTYIYIVNRAKVQGRIKKAYTLTYVIESLAKYMKEAFDRAQACQASGQCAVSCVDLGPNYITILDSPAGGVTTLYCFAPYSGTNPGACAPTNLGIDYEGTPYCLGSNPRAVASHFHFVAGSSDLLVAQSDESFLLKKWTAFTNIAEQVLEKFLPEDPSRYMNEAFVMNRAYASSPTYGGVPEYCQQGGSGGDEQTQATCSLTQSYGIQTPYPSSLPQTVVNVKNRICTTGGSQTLCSQQCSMAAGTDNCVQLSLQVDPGFNMTSNVKIWK